MDNTRLQEQAELQSIDFPTVTSDWELLSGERRSPPSHTISTSCSPIKLNSEQVFTVMTSTQKHASI